MVEVDGSEGGGQLVRSALALSMLDGEPVTVTDIRGDRSTPGLKPQHAAAVRTAASVADAAIDGAVVESDSVSFAPDGLSGGHCEAEIGAARSLTLLFDTFLPLAAAIDEPLSITAAGGTDVKWSPPLSYYRSVKLPVLRQFGVAAALECERTGFYPAGGGRATLHLWPSTVSELDLSRRGPATSARVFSKASAALAEGEVADRQADAATDALEGLGIEPVERRTTYVTSDSPGSVLTVRVDVAGTPAGFDAYGAPSKPAEAVANEVADRIRWFRESEAAVDPHLADQLLVFLAFVGGRVPIPKVSDHVSSSLALLETFGHDVTLDRSGEAPTLVGDRPRRTD